MPSGHDAFFGAPTAAAAVAGAVAEADAVGGAAGPDALRDRKKPAPARTIAAPPAAAKIAPFGDDGRDDAPWVVRAAFICDDVVISDDGSDGVAPRPVIARIGASVIASRSA